ncbi:MAG TPA: 6-carboxytetrahydropterin synthase [Gemmatimonadales bacterium]|nr:6-carboxytetrahydropterin synthase [Gemmatimonadales bacterium]
MPVSYLTRVVEFTATHQVRRPDWTPERNQAEFGKASLDHSHRYRVRVTVKGPLAPREAGVVNLGALDRLLAEEVIGRFDGRHINRDVPEFGGGGLLATGEALAVYLWERLAPRLPPGVALHAIRVQEGPHLYSEYFGEP